MIVPVTDRSIKGSSVREKVKVELGSVQKTLLLPLWGRAIEARQPHPLLVDREAGEIVHRLDYDFSDFEANLDEISRLGWIVRCVHIDATVKRFLESYPKATVVNIGCGLDTTYERVDNGTLRWYDLDLPDVLSLRQQLIPQKERSVYLAGSVFDTSWFDEVEVADNIFFIASGVFYYFDESQVKELLLKIADRFPGSEIIFDASSPLGVKMANRMVLDRGGMDTPAALTWGISSCRKLEEWDDRLKVIEEYPYFHHFKNGNAALTTRVKVLLWNLFKISYMVHVKFC
jgi:O-methyltransferase involved in polyketide biosynthesis